MKYVYLMSVAGVHVLIIKKLLTCYGTSNWTSGVSRLIDWESLDSSLPCQNANCNLKMCIDTEACSISVIVFVFDNLNVITKVCKLKLDPLML
jgi:hypothetical protein